MTKMGPGMFWSWRSDASHSCNDGEETRILFGVPAFKFQLYLKIRFVIVTTVGFKKKHKGGKRHIRQRLSQFDDKEGNEKTQT